MSGGVFQNRLLSERMKAALEKSGFKVLVHRQVPCNDGGLSLGQAVIANFINLKILLATESTEIIRRIRNAKKICLNDLLFEG